MATLAAAMANYILKLDTRAVVGEVLEKGYDGVEVLADVPFCQVDLLEPRLVDEMRDAFRNAGMRVSVHAPFFGINLCCVNPGILRESVRQVKASIDLARTLGAETVVSHLGSIPSHQPEVIQYATSVALDVFRDIKEYARARGVLFTLENCGVEPRDIENSLEYFVDFVERADLSVTLDVGHAHVTWGVRRTFEALLPRLRHVHIHDNHGGWDEHLPIGEGNIPFESDVVPFLKDFPGILAMETMRAPDPRQSTWDSRNRLRQMGL